MSSDSAYEKRKPGESAKSKKQILHVLSHFLSFRTFGSNFEFRIQEILPQFTELF
jgi:hypothetical protein